MPKITIADFERLLETEMPWTLDSGLVLEEIGRGTAVMRLPYQQNMLRPGGTLSGPTMMLADANMYAVVLSAVGEVKLAVTTSFNINFMHRPKLGDLRAEGRLLNAGRCLAVVEVSVFSEKLDEPVAHATGTYSIPPDRN